MQLDAESDSDAHAAKFAFPRKCERTAKGPTFSLQHAGIALTEGRLWPRHCFSSSCYQRKVSIFAYMSQPRSSIKDFISVAEKSIRRHESEEERPLLPLMSTIVQTEVPGCQGCQG